VVRGAVLAPGYGGTAEQPILLRLASGLERRGMVCERVTFGRTGGGPRNAYAAELQALREARTRLCAAGVQQLALVGRSFGGRMCTRLAVVEPPSALVLLGHPIRPPGRPRPEDEAALLALRCPTLIVQGDRDERGPLSVLEAIAAQNACIALFVLAGVGHEFGARTKDAVARAVDWLAAVPGASAQLS
jgi:predicted alpha/beta-hydrolase family hydrolase